jgi:hypothetical protein
MSALAFYFVKGIPRSLQIFHNLNHTITSAASIVHAPTVQIEGLGKSAAFAQPLLACRELLLIFISVHGHRPR